MCLCVCVSVSTRSFSISVPQHQKLQTFFAADTKLLLLLRLPAWRIGSFSHPFCAQTNARKVAPSWKSKQGLQLMSFGIIRKSSRSRYQAQEEKNRQVSVTKFIIPLCDPYFLIAIFFIAQNGVGNPSIVQKFVINVISL